MPSPDYSVVVPAFDEEEHLPRTLAAIREAMAAVPWSGEVVVCDNNSADGTAAAARAAGARVVFEPRNQIARARNAGARAAAGRWLVFVDADTLPSGPLLAEALDLLRSGRVGGGGSVLRMASVGSRAGDLMVRTWNGISRRFHVAAGSFLFARRDLFEEAGGFPEWMYAGEEVGLTLRLRRLGRRRGLAFRVLDRHPVETSPRKMEWYSSWTLLGTLLLMTLCPLLVRSRAFCRIWYRRPRPAAAPPPVP